MTASDLGCTADDGPAAPPLVEGEFRLLILVQQPGLRTHGCVSAAPGATTFEQRVPLFTGPDDPLVAVVETLIQVADSRSRRERATLLVDRLADADGTSAVPLLSSLQLRADWAAADERAYAPLARLARDERSAVRGAALEVLREIMATRNTPNNPQQLDGVADALRQILNSDEANTGVRLAALESLGHLLALNADIDWARELLIKQLTGAADTRRTWRRRYSTVAYRDTRNAVAAVLTALTGLPLDDTAERESVYARAAVRVEAAGAEQVLLARLERSIAARQSLEAEIVALGRMRSKESLPLLLAAADQHNLSNADRHYLAWALGQMGDDRAVPALRAGCEGDDYQVKEVALEALENIDSPVAAREVRSLLKSEAHLPYKLRLARLLARHDMADGYALATEHLSDVDHTAAAALVLAALGDPRTSKDLSAILAVSARPALACSGISGTGDDRRRGRREAIARDFGRRPAPLSRRSGRSSWTGRQLGAIAPIGQAHAIAKQAGRNGLAGRVAEISQRGPALPARPGGR